MRYTDGEPRSTWRARILPGCARSFAARAVTAALAAAALAGSGGCGEAARRQAADGGTVRRLERGELPAREASEPATATAREPRPVLPLKHLMRGLVMASYDGLRETLEGGALIEAEWDKVERHAWLLHEASYLLMDPPPRGDEAWTIAASQMLRSGSRRVLEAAESRDPKAAEAAVLDMTRACRTCHQECPADLGLAMR